MRLCPSQGKGEFEERFVEEIYRAKKKLWHITVEEKEEEKKLLRSYLIVRQSRFRISSRPT